MYALVTDGAFTEEGEFLQLPYFDARLVEEVSRRFSVNGEQTVSTEDLQGAERLARYLTRGPLPIDVVEKVEGGRLRVRTPPDPRTGLADKILDPLDLIHALTTQIPDPGQHMVRYYAWYSMLRRIFEIDPLLCPACGSEMTIVSVITEPDVIDAILRHPAKTGRRDPFEGHAPPAA